MNAVCIPFLLQKWFQSYSTCLLQGPLTSCPVHLTKARFPNRAPVWPLKTFDLELFKPLESITIPDQAFPVLRACLQITHKHVSLCPCIEGLLEIKFRKRPNQCEISRNQTLIPSGCNLHQIHLCALPTRVRELQETKLHKGLLWAVMHTEILFITIWFARFVDKIYGNLDTNVHF